MFPVPAYIESSGILNQEIKYEWKPYLGMKIIEKYSPTIAKLVDGISLRATLAAGLGVAEWMLWRIDAKARDKQPYVYFEALWARTLGPDYLAVEEPERPKDKGDKIHGPLRALEQAMADFLIKATLDLPERGKSVAQLVALVRYTLPSASAFDKWLEAVLRRFSKQYPYDPDDAGVLVPRAFLDPEVPLEQAKVPALLDEQLRFIDWKGNPFLATPEAMVANGFEGTPYRYLS